MSDSPDPVRTIQIDRAVAKFFAVVLGIGGILVGLVALVSAGNLADNRVAQIAFGVGVLGLLAFVLLDPGAIRTALTGRRARYASNSVLMSVAFTAILVMAFIVLVDLEDSVDWLTVDLTEDQQFSLGEQSLDLLAGLEEPVTVIGFYTNQQGALQDDAEIWLQEYQQHSDGMLTYEFVDPELRPGVAQQYDVSRPGVLVVTQGDRSAEANIADERNITGALIRALKGEPRQVYALTGHGERATDQFDDSSLQRATDALVRQNYEINTFNLFESDTVPDDADVVVVAGPTTQFRQEEVDAISAYLADGGALMVMLEPNAATGIRTSGVQDAVFSPDGSLLATASADDTGQLWDVASARQVVTLSGHRGDVQGIAFSPDGKMLATASGDSTVRLWGVNGEELATLQGHEASVRRVAFSPDGQRLASAGFDQAVIVWSLNGEIEQQFIGQGAALDVAFSPDGTLLAAAFEDGSVRVWNLDGEQVANQRPHVSQAVAVAFSPDGSTVLSAGLDGTLGVLDVESGIADSLEPYPGIPITDVSYVGDDTVLLALADLTVRAWDADLNAEQFALQTEHGDLIWEVGVSPDGETIATASGDGNVELWSLADQERITTLRGEGGGDPLLTYLNDVWDITVNDDLVVDVTQGSQFDEFTPVSSFYGDSPITEPLLNGGLFTFFTAARSLSIPQEPPENLSLTALVLTGTNSWGETNLADLVVGTAPDETDIPGPLALGVSGENPETGGRVVVFGDVDFATNASLQSEAFGNLDLFVNSVNWLAEEEELINIQSRGTTRLFEPLPGATLILVIIGVMCAIPGIVGVIGVIVWRGRRART